MKQVKQMTMIFALLLGLGVHTANAALIDQGDTTLDDVNNLEWLDLSLTAGKSINTALGEYAGDGWRLATQDEVFGLLDPLFPGYETLSGYTGIDYATHSANAIEFASLLGATGGATGVDYIYGLYLDGTAADFSGVQLGDTFINLHRDRTMSLDGADFTLSTMGVYLVKTASVPEASSLAMFAIGLLGLGFARRRKFK